MCFSCDLKLDKEIEFQNEWSSEVGVMLLEPLKLFAHPFRMLRVPRQGHFSKISLRCLVPDFDFKSLVKFSKHHENTLVAVWMGVSLVCLLDNVLYCGDLWIGCSVNVSHCGPVLDEVCCLWSEDSNIV